MTHRDREVICRMLGQIEGAACSMENEGAANLIFEAVLNIGEIIEKEIADNG